MHIQKLAAALVSDSEVTTGNVIALLFHVDSASNQSLVASFVDGSTGLVSEQPIANIKFSDPTLAGLILS